MELRRAVPWTRLIAQILPPPRAPAGQAGAAIPRCSAAHAAGPAGREPVVELGVDRLTECDVGDREASGGAQDAEYLVVDGVLLRGQVDHAVRDHHVLGGIR